MLLSVKMAALCSQNVCQLEALRRQRENLCKKMWEMGEKTKEACGEQNVGCCKGEMNE